MSRALLKEDSKTNSAVDADKLTDSVFLTRSVKSWWVHEVMHPLESFFVRHKVHPNTLTWIGASLTLLSSVMLAMNWLIFGGWFLFFAASFDFLDGRIARITGQTSKAGGFLDSVMDRYTDAAIFFGLAYLFRDSWVVVLCLLALFGSMTTSYVRAKAESMGLKASGGSMQRPERILYVGTGAALSGYYECLLYPFKPVGWTTQPIFLIAAVAFIAVVSNKVAIDRIRDALKQLS